MSGNSNPSINSPASSNHELNTLIGEDAQFATNLLQEFNDQQTRHILVSSTNSSVQYVPHFPTPSVQEVMSPPPLQVRIGTNSIGHYPPISPGSAETILCMEDNNLTDTAHAVAYSLISTVRCHTTLTSQCLVEARCRINQLAGTVHSCKAEIRHIRNSNRNPEMPPDFEHNGRRVNIQVSSHSGENVITKWIQVMGNSEVVAQAGEHVNKPEYMVSLYLSSDYSQ